ncbi:MAG: hypothetical protein HC822_13185 [Oscillochloris sp.]|nr:hypothetical protein [Oscillochloris sp.]
MAASTPKERNVTRTYRAAIRIGEDFITLEETISLPIDAADDEVQQAVDLGWRIYRAQREAVEGQVAQIREQQGIPTAITVRDPDAPASEKQRNYIAALQDDLTWSNEQLTSYADEHRVDLVTMTKGQASTFIDGLKKLAEERTRYQADNRQNSGERRNEAEPFQPASEKQLQALARIAQSRSIDLDAETTRRFDVVADKLSDEQARSLLSEWQSRTPRNNRKAEAAL